MGTFREHGPHYLGFWFSKVRVEWPEIKSEVGFDGRSNALFSFYVIFVLYWMRTGCSRPFTPARKRACDSNILQKRWLKSLKVTSSFSRKKNWVLGVFLTLYSSRSVWWLQTISPTVTSYKWGEIICNPYIYITYTDLFHLTFLTRFWAHYL